MLTKKIQYNTIPLVMKTWKQILVAVFLMISVSAQTRADGPVQEFDQQELYQTNPAEVLNGNQVYHETLKLCLHPTVSEQINHGFQSGAELAELVLDPFLPIRDPKAISRLWSVSEKLDQMWNHPAFDKALDQCFGNDEFKKKKFTYSLLATDVAGKLAGIYVGKVLFWDGIGMLINGVGKTIAFPAKTLISPAAGQAVYNNFHRVMLALAGYGIGSMLYDYIYKPMKYGLPPNQIQMLEAPVYEMMQLRNDFLEGKISKNDLKVKMWILGLELPIKYGTTLSLIVDHNLREIELTRMLKKAKTEKERKAIQKAIERVRNDRAVILDSKIQQSQFNMDPTFIPGLDQEDCLPEMPEGVNPLE